MCGIAERVRSFNQSFSSSIVVSSGGECGVVACALVNVITKVAAVCGLSPVNRIKVTFSFDPAAAPAASVPLDINGFVPFADSFTLPDLDMLRWNLKSIFHKLFQLHHVLALYLHFQPTAAPF